MTITFNRNTGELTLAHSGETRIVSQHRLRSIAEANGWGDVESLINQAKQKPGIAITVGNVSRVPAPRNSRVYAVQQ